MNREQQLKRRVRTLLTVFIVCLIVSGLTAFALETELSILSELFGVDAAAPPSTYPGARYWVARVAQGLRATNAQYPFIAYGTDWLAFGHLVIALTMLGAVRDPVRNVWVVTVGMIACAGVIPLAFIAGEIREIPLGWRLIDSSFGIVGIIPLWISRRYIVQLEKLERERLYHDREVALG